MQKRFRVVHLDDHKLFQEGIQRCIDPEKKKFLIQKFHYSDDALSYIENAFEEGMKIDLIITDFNHLQVNGYEFSKRIRELDKIYLRHTPILLLTIMSRGSHPLIDLGVKKGIFNNHLSKGSECYEVIEAIDSLLKTNHP
ncbi:MAG: response regulator [Bacteroidota bacterium]|nr:response regulator [Bacteroidota bacterium]